MALYNYCPSRYRSYLFNTVPTKSATTVLSSPRVHECRAYRGDTSITVILSVYKRLQLWDEVQLYDLGVYWCGEYG